MDETERLAAFVAGTEYGDLPADAVGTAKTAIRDFVGVALYGSRQPVGGTVADYVARAMPGGDATTIGGGTASAEGAALANGVAGHAIDYDDTFASIPIHPTGPAFSAALAVAEAEGATTRDLLAGYLVGVETTYRVGHATFPGHYYGGFHSTGTAGTFGATAAAASVVELDETAVRRAIGVAASGSSSLLENFGTMTKPYHAGHAAAMGVRAALLADDGFTANEAILEGETGYGKVTSFGDYDPDEITDGLGEEWAIDEVGFKAYPVILIVQAPMEALRRIAEREDIAPDEVATIRATLPDAAEDVLDYDRPDDADQAKFSVEFPLAAVLRERTVGVDHVTDEYVRDPETRTAMGTVERVFDSDALGEGFDRYGGRVTVTTADGEAFTEDEPITPGMPDNPLPEDRLRAKFFDCAEAALDREAAEALIATVDVLEDADLDDLSRRLS